MAAKQTDDGKHGEIPKVLAKDLNYDKTPIGRGGYGYVYRGTHTDLGTVAIKTMITDGILPARHLRVFKSEAKALWELRHPSVVRLLGLIMEENNYSLVLEYMHFGSLSSFRTDFPNVSWSIIISIVRDIVTGMDFLHSRVPPILHLDMKSDNILINRKIRAKITDFGLAQWKTMTRTITQSQRTTEDIGRKGTVTHVPPEVWNNVNIPPNKAYDIYGFAIVIWEALTGSRPFGNTSDDIIPKAVLSGQRPDIGLVPHNCPAKLSSMMTQCWNQKPDVRPNFSELKPQVDVLFESFVHTVPKDLQDLEKAIGELYTAEDIGGDTTETNKSETLYDVVTKMNPPSHITPEMVDVEEQQTTSQPSTSQPSTSTTNQNTPVASTSNQNAPLATQTNANKPAINQTASNTESPNQAAPVTAVNQNVSTRTSEFTEEEMKGIRRVLFDPVAMLLIHKDSSLCFNVYKISVPTQKKLKNQGVLMRILEENPELKMDLMKRGTDYLGWLFNPEEMKEIICKNRISRLTKLDISEKMRNLRKEREKREEEEFQKRAPPQVMYSGMGDLAHLLNIGRSRGYNRSPYDCDDDDELTMFGDLGYKIVKAFHNSDTLKYAMGEGHSSMMAPIDQEVLDVLRNPDRLVMMLERDPNFRAKLMKINSKAVMKIISRARIPNSSSFGDRRAMRQMMHALGLERDLMDMDLDEDDEMRDMGMMDIDDFDMFPRMRIPHLLGTSSKGRMSNSMRKIEKMNKMSAMMIPPSASAMHSAKTSTPAAAKSAETSSASTKEDKSNKPSASNLPSSRGSSSTCDSSSAKKTDTKNTEDQSKNIKENEKKETVKEEVVKAPVQRHTTTQPLATVYPPGMNIKETGTSVDHDDNVTVSNSNQMVVNSGKRGQNPEASGNSKKVKKNGKLKSLDDKNKANDESDESDN